MASSKPHGDGPKPAHSPGGKCPICTAPSELAYRPFCSRRCADVDLSRWLRGGYAIHGRADVDEDGDDSIAASATQQRPRNDEDEDEGGSRR